jgi:hypothetical protein
VLGIAAASGENVSLINFVSGCMIRNFDTASFC